MEPDNLYPNDSSYFLPTEPKEQVIARKREKAKTLEELTTIRAIISHLEERIAFYGSVDSIPKEVKTDPTKFMNVCNSNQLTRDCLVSEKEYIESLLDTVGTKEV